VITHLKLHLLRAQQNNLEGLWWRWIITPLPENWRAAWYPMSRAWGIQGRHPRIMSGTVDTVRLEVTDRPKSSWWQTTVVEYPK
jgi:hypothetical protein